MSDRPGEALSRRGSWWGLVLVAVIYLGLGLAFSQSLHFSRAFDEGYHLEYIEFIKQQGRLPTSYAERATITRADFPPLYHLLVSVASAPVRITEQPYFKLFWDSFRYRAVDHLADEVWSLETEDFQWPYFGRFLVWQIGRWLSVGLSLGTVLVLFFTLRELPPLARIPAAPLAGAALLAFWPRYLILGSTLNDDNLLGLVAALYFLALVEAINRPGRWWPFAAMGLLLGLSMTVKYTLVVVPLEVVVVCLLLARRYNLGWGWAGRRIGLVGLLAIVGSSWWFGWNLWFLNTVAEEGWPGGLLRPLLVGGTDTTMNRIGGLLSGGQVGLTALPEDTAVGTFGQWLKYTFLSFWGVDFGGHTPFSPYAYLLIGLLLATVGWGLGRLWRSDSGSRWWLGLLGGHVALFVALPVLRFFLTRRLSVAAQGRHILVPAAAAVVGLLVWGLAAAVTPRWRRPLLGLLVAAFLAWSGAHLVRVRAIARPPLPLRSMPQAADWLPQAANARFGETMELASYRLEPRPEQGQLAVSLAWRALAYANQNYRLYVALVDDRGEVVSYWLGYNGQGRLPTIGWDPGDSVFDRLVLPLPGLAAGEYTVRVQVWDRAGQPVAVDGAEDSLAPVTLAQPARLPPAQRRPLAGVEGGAFALWRAGGPVKSDRPVYRYPATITVITWPDLAVNLVDEAGTAWPAAHRQANIHTFIIGPRWPDGHYRLGLPDGSVGEPVLTVENWWQRQFEPPEVAVPLEANFANQVRLLGYKLPQAQVEAGRAFPLTLYWQALPDRPPQADLTQFNRLLDSSGQVWGGYDRQPLEYYSTLLWAPGEVVVDGYAVPVEAEAPPGQYYLNVGYYVTVGESAVNLPLVVEGQMTEVTAVTIGPVEVTAP